jgi:hypothetical protein
MDRPNPSDEQIRSLAYSLWEKRGKPLGASEADWLEAETELKGDGEDDPMSRVARRVGSALGSVAAFLGEIQQTRSS